ncbi:DRMBL-domain-containing protein, partial [Piedraia hortae CBS 480.64]
FQDDEEFEEDVFEEGDEYRERRFMEEQAREDCQVKGIECPICAKDMLGLGEEEVAVHVNRCLDGEPLPAKEVVIGAEGAGEIKKIPKPGQANPITLGEGSKKGSAFNRLMSGHAESAAWAEAASSEIASRGKPAYQRTCPFYKILPGFSICVDAFRYGAVADCQAYFLSHFHSDHYIGLSSSWTHGPIYCSKVTANLVKQQLRVDPQYVVPLEFEVQVEVPGTNGVKVTMIPANHCPGSSLFLFEKTTHGSLKRVLHCGDFRACRMHVEHPLLMPDVRCKITGKTKEQKIDVCYLDTTYLNPKYAFPSQTEVIDACADICVRFSKHSVDDSDGWKTVNRQRAGESMANFVRTSHQNVEEADDGEEIKLQKSPYADQKILKTKQTPKVESGCGRLLVVVGTYSIGKERICLGIAKALNSKIYAPAAKRRIVAALEDPELDERMTSDPRSAQVHMTPLFDIRAETLDDYLREHYPHFTRAVGFRPSGWNYRPPGSRFLDAPAVQTVLNGDNWKSTYKAANMVPQRGSTGRTSCFGVPYSEHSSFRELTMFCCALRIDKVIPTVNVGSAKSRERMKTWCERWTAEKKKNGLWKLPADEVW